MELLLLSTSVHAQEFSPLLKSQLWAKILLGKEQDLELEVITSSLLLVGDLLMELFIFDCFGKI